MSDASLHVGDQKRGETRHQLATTTLLAFLSRGKKLGHNHRDRCFSKASPVNGTRRRKSSVGVAKRVKGEIENYNCARFRVIIIHSSLGGRMEKLLRVIVSSHVENYMQVK